MSAPQYVSADISVNAKGGKVQYLLHRWWGLAPSLGAAAAEGRTRTSQGHPVRVRSPGFPISIGLQTVLPRKLDLPSVKRNGSKN